MQSHAGRIEIWVVLSGQILARKGENELTLREGGQIRIEKEEKHRIKGLTDACVLEIAFGELSEEDIVRYEDKYGRVSKKIPSRN